VSTNFVETQPTREDYWRSVILFGANVASYKFALGKALLELAPKPEEFVSLSALAEPFSRHICEHLRQADKQGTSGSSKFLEACRAANRGELTPEQLRDATARLGFNNVIDAFHVVNGAEIPTRFFVDERTGQKKGIRVTDELRRLGEAFQYRNLPAEVEARWRLVETAWELQLPASVLAVSFDPDTERLVVDGRQGRRRDVTGCRDALNGYQRGRCFYCRVNIAVCEGKVDVDHFLPHTLKERGFPANLDGVWNLVLACESCNRGPAGKWARVPEIRFLERLHTRGEFLIGSHHPLRETLMRQTGETPEARRQFLQAKWNEARGLLIHTWRPEQEEEVEF
jgi:5-methylcytosine-specific restriction endonuclease McrA